MNPPKCSDEDYINFVIATPKQLTATEAARVQPESQNAPAHDAFTRLLQRLEPDAETLWLEAATQINKEAGILVLDDSTLDKPFSKHNALVSRHWSGKHQQVVLGINLMTLLWTDSERAIPTDYRIFDKDTDGKTKNDHFQEMLLEAHKRGFEPQLVCFDSWYSALENLKLCRALGWYFLTRLKSNRKVNPDKEGLKPISEIFISATGRVVWLQGFGFIKVFRTVDENGNAKHWATNKVEMTEDERKDIAKQANRIEQYHRGIKQFCLIERSQARRRQPWLNHILLCLRAFLRLECHCYRTKTSWHEAKVGVIRDAIRDYLKNPKYSLIPTA
jgi:putative transposase